MKKCFLLSCFYLLGIVSPNQAQPDVNRVLGLIQEQTPWKQVSQPRPFTSANLHEIQPKLAPVFQEYGFSRLIRQEFELKQESVRVDIYEMIDSVAAFGVFTYLRQGTELHGIGNMAEEQTSQVSFMQNRYYVQLNSPQRSPAVQSALREKARIISGDLPKSYSLPAIVQRLPQEGLVENSEAFMLGPLAMNERFLKGDDDPFGIVNGAEAAIARYENSQDQAMMVLIQYPTQQLAKKFLERGYQEYATRYPDRSVFFKREGPLVVLVVGATSPEFSAGLMEKVSYVSTVSWDPKSQPMNVGHILLNIFIFIGIILLMTTGIGVAFGSFRVILKKLYPDKIFDRSKDIEIIRLNLSGPDKQETAD